MLNNLLNFLLTKEFKQGNSFGLFILRFTAGLLLFFGHGFKKLSVIFSGSEIQFGDPIGLGPELSFYLVAFAEGICSLFLAAGFFTRISTLILIINFLVILNVHAADGLAKLELGLFYFFSFATLFFTGAGKFSLDHLLFNKKK